MKTSILILTHNAPEYVEETIRTVNLVTDPLVRSQTEVIVYDNASSEETKKVLEKLDNKGYIDKLVLSEVNTFFARGNNLAAAISSEDSRYLLLLNSDVKINDPEWLERLISLKKDGDYVAASYGYCPKPDRADGYCLLIDRDTYMTFGLDENFPWWGGVSKLQAQLIAEGNNILAIDRHDNMVFHYGGRSGRDYRDAGPLSEEYSEVMKALRRGPGRVDVLSLGRGGMKAVLKTKLRKTGALLRKL